MPLHAIRLTTLAIACAGLSAIALASPSPQQGVERAIDAIHSPLPGKESATRCVSAASEYHKVNPWVLKAILSVESNFRPGAVNRNQNGTLDVGMAQINSLHFRELAGYGIAPAHLMDACVATYVAAWHLAKQMRQRGNTWQAIGAYHSSTPCHNQRYAALVWNRLLSWRAVTGERLPVQSMEACRIASGQKATSTKPVDTHREARLVVFDATQ
jgi:soluble lytic murein transglycosylase-like protein